ncbi:hypothetical protein [Aureispira anguillae]|uniref:Uncharacterized protein n=1 Tax=Aureispira anguillae TaxID=2864201 RepID=A0A915YBJ7_9BACT|nr:hypothetical protein [Aureispira anguillae]BDS10003.1 hypothetical protein AsAng_0007080 [Aureispira anguillae]
MKYQFLCLLLCCAFSSFADNYEPKDVAELQAQYNLLIDLRNEGSISEGVFEEKTTYLEQLAINKFQVDIEGLGLQQIVPAQRIDWIGSAFYVISALLLLVILGPLLTILFKPIVRFIKQFMNTKIVQKIIQIATAVIKKTWEALAYISLFLLFYFFRHEYATLVTSFALGSLVSYSIYLRKGKTKATVYRTIGAWVLTILWGLIAYFGNNSFVGFMAVASFISSIGFFFFMNSGLILLGFKKDDTFFLLRLTLFTFVLTLLSWLIFYTNYVPVLSALKPHLRVFETGMVSLIPLVAFLGLFYINFIYTYRDDLFKKIALETIALILALAVLVIALLYGIGSMFWIGLLSTIWFSADKYYWLVYKKVDFVWAGLILAILLAGIGSWIKTNLPMIMEQLEFLNL